MLIIGDCITSCDGEALEERKIQDWIAVVVQRACGDILAIVEHDAPSKIGISYISLGCDL